MDIHKQLTGCGTHIYVEINLVQVPLELKGDFSKTFHKVCEAAVRQAWQ